MKPTILKGENISMHKVYAYYYILVFRDFILFFFIKFEISFDEISYFKIKTLKLNVKLFVPYITLFNLF